MRKLSARLIRLRIVPPIARISLPRCSATARRFSSLNQKERGHESRASISPSEAIISLKHDRWGVLLKHSHVKNDTYLEHIALRHLCQCRQCVDPSTRQRLISFADIPTNIRANCTLAQQDSHAAIKISWTNDVDGFDDNHISSFVAEDLFQQKSILSRSINRHSALPVRAWNADDLASDRSTQLEYGFDNLISSKRARDAAAYKLLQWGLIFIKDAPLETDAVKRVVECFGPIRNTFYGETWDVRSVPQAKNVAYTARNLGFHQDLLYMANPPGLQALHVLRASSSDGESLFTDGARAMHSIIDHAREHLEALFQFPVTYHYRNAGEWYEYTRPTLEGGLPITDPIAGIFTRKQGQQPEPYGYGVHFDAINWSPPFLAPLQVDCRRAVQQKRNGDNSPGLLAYHAAASALRTQIERPDAVYETRLEPGTCVIFNNRRIMHARRGFPSEGIASGEERWLRGAYADMDPLLSRYRMMEGVDREVVND